MASGPSLLRNERAVKRWAWHRAKSARWCFTFIVKERPATESYDQQIYWRCAAALAGSLIEICSRWSLCECGDALQRRSDTEERSLSGVGRYEVPPDYKGGQSVIVEIITDICAERRWYKLARYFITLTPKCRRGRNSDAGKEVKAGEGIRQWSHGYRKPMDDRVPEVVTGEEPGIFRFAQVRGVCSDWAGWAESEVGELIHYLLGAYRKISHGAQSDEAACYQRRPKRLRMVSSPQHIR